MMPISEVQKTYGTEIAMVLLCCRLHFKIADQRTLQQFIDANTIDWDDVLYLARYHRIEPVVYAVLGKAGLPPAIASHIKQSQLLLIRNNFKQALETERIVLLLAESGITCTPYKGVAFSKQFYGDTISRESSDIDLVISHHDFNRVLDIMTADGYLFENKTEYDHFRETIFEKNNSLNFDRFKGEIREFHVEFHWRITENFVNTPDAAHEQLFKNSETIILARLELPALNVNAHYITTFIHHSSHDGFRVLRNIIDLCQIKSCNNPSLNINYITANFRKLRLTRAAAVCSYLSTELLGVELPFSREVETVVISDKLKTFFKKRLLVKRSYRDSVFDNLDTRSQLYLKDSFKEKISFILSGIKQRAMPSPEDLRTVKLPRKWHFLYPVIKPFRLLTRGIDKKHVKKF